MKMGNILVKRRIKVEKNEDENFYVKSFCKIGTTCKIWSQQVAQCFFQATYFVQLCS